MKHIFPRLCSLVALLCFALTFSGSKDRPEAVRDFVRQTDVAKLKALLP